MKASLECLALIKHFEGCRLRSYPDPGTGARPWTIGWGSTGPEIGPGVVWDQQRADARLAGDVTMRDGDANNAIKVAVTQGQYDAFVSILFNVGHGSPVRDGIVRLKTAYPSTLLRKLNAADYIGARAEFVRWCSPGTNVSAGLLKRRKAEQLLWDGLSAAEAIAGVQAMEGAAP